MKRKIILLAFVALCAMAYGQGTTPDTMRVGDRDPIYYYWDTNWMDYYYFPPESSDSLLWKMYTNAWPLGMPEYARYCYTDTALRIIGVAAPLQFRVVDCRVFPWQPYDSLVWEHMYKEYFRLYEVDSNTCDMILLKETEINLKQNFRHYIETNIDGQTRQGQWVSMPNPIYEGYFDEPVTVHDSFYVAVTFNNNRLSEPDGSTPPPVLIASSCFTASVQIRNSDPTAYSFDYVPHPPHQRFRFTNMVGDDSLTLYYAYIPTDCQWHYVVRMPRSNRPEGFYYIFPIIDTSRYVPPAFNCNAPSELSLPYSSPEVCLFTWNGDGGSEWELSIAEQGQAPEDGMMTLCNSTIKSISGLDTGRCYEAWVRTVCNDTLKSQWSNSIHFCINEGQTGILTATDVYTYLYPNPTNGIVTVSSAFRMDKIEVFALNGTMLLSVSTDAMSTDLDLSSLPAGTYIIRIHTNNGFATKRLVKK